jgi:hypothetical protein
LCRTQNKIKHTVVATRQKSSRISLQLTFNSGSTPSGRTLPPLSISSRRFIVGGIGDTTGLARDVLPPRSTLEKPPFRRLSGHGTAFEMGVSVFMLGCRSIVVLAGSFVFWLKYVLCVGGRYGGGLALTRQSPTSRRWSTSLRVYQTLGDYRDIVRAL